MCEVIPKREWLCPKCEFTETGHNPHGEHATIKDAFADYNDGQGSTSESPTLNTLISDAKQVSDHHYSAQGRKIGMSHTKDRSTKVKQSPRMLASTVKDTLGSDPLASVNSGPTYSGTCENPINVSYVKDQPLAWEDQPWIAQLNLAVKERKILQERNWLNDAVINAAMILLRRQRRDNRIGGLEDVVVARKGGFPCSDSGQGFVQIINIRQNHWLTLSNVLWASSHTCVYDSLNALTLTLRPNKKQVSYPINVDQAACQTSRCDESFPMVVENVQQQNLGEDCGLFAIVFAALLCNNQDPAKAVINQSIKRQELLHGLQDIDITRFVNKVTKIDESKEPTILYQWTCKVYCIYHMPDYGSKMVQCSKCKTWYHQKCVRGECTRNDWLCRNC